MRKLRTNMQKRGEMLCKKGQVSVFVILAIAIIAVLALLFYRDPIVNVFSPRGPVEDIQKCTQESVNEGLEILRLQGGSIDPENYFMIQDNKVEYLCYTNEYYKRCVNQRPLLKQHIEEELVEYITPKVKECVKELEESLEGNGNTVNYQEPIITIDIDPGNILTDVELDLTISKEQTEFYKSIKTSVDSEMYQFIMIASSINNWEAQYGESEILNYMLYYPDLRVDKKKQGDGTTIYILTSRKNEEQFWFAERSVVFPPGVTGT
jgi:hypothetical protein